MLEFLWICFLDFNFSAGFSLAICYGHSRDETRNWRKKKDCNWSECKKGRRYLRNLFEFCSHARKDPFFLLLFVLCIYISFISLRCSLSEPFIPFGHHTFFWCIKKIFWIPSKELWIVYSYCVAGMMKQTINKSKNILLTRSSASTWNHSHIRQTKKNWKLYLQRNNNTILINLMLIFANIKTDNKFICCIFYKHVFCFAVEINWY